MAKRTMGAVVLWVVGVGFALPADVVARDRIFVRIEGIKGDVTATGFEGQIRASSAAFDVSRVFDEAGGETETGRPNFGDLVITKRADVASAELFRAVVESRFAPVLVSFTTTFDEFGLTSFFEIWLVDGAPSKFQFSSDGRGRPIETVAFYYERACLRHTELRPGGTQVPGPWRCYYRDGRPAS